MKKLIFATHNQNKVQELKAVFDGFSIASLAKPSPTWKLLSLLVPVAPSNSLLREEKDIRVT